MALAKQIGCSKNILLNWEMDVWIPKLKHLRKLNDVLEIPYYNLGLLLRIFRLSLIITHKEFAKILNVNPSTIFKWERGRNKPNSKIPEKILSIKP